MLSLRNGRLGPGWCKDNHPFLTTPKWLIDANLKFASQVFYMYRKSAEPGGVFARKCPEIRGSKLKMPRGQLKRHEGAAGWGAFCFETRIEGIFWRKPRLACVDFRQNDQFLCFTSLQRYKKNESIRPRGRPNFWAISRFYVKKATLYFWSSHSIDAVQKHC